jgi:hypothetical protein
MLISILLNYDMDRNFSRYDSVGEKNDEYLLHDFLVDNEPK